MKVITVPLTIEAMKRLDTDSNIEGDLVDIEIAQKDIDILYKSGATTELNKNLEIFIDDFEDELISYKNIDKALLIINKYTNSNHNDPLIFEILREQLLTAKDAETGVFLYF